MDGLPIGRRSLLAASGVLGAAGAAAGLGLTLSPARDRPGAPAVVGGHPGRLPAGAGPGRPPAVPTPEGTTAWSVSVPRGGSGYRRLRPGPSWEYVVRDDQAPAQKGRADRRTTLASFVQLTDQHVQDVQHPLRFEYLRAGIVTAWRPQEALTVQGNIALLERINALPGGPVTGAPLQFAITTGDNTDNHSRLELEWYLTLMTGGTVTPNSGDPLSYEGVQNSGLDLYWQPESARTDNDKKLGFPRIPGFLAAAVRPVPSPGLRLPWYSTPGNHDVLPGGCFRPHGRFAEFATGDRKLETLPAAQAEYLWRGVRKGRDIPGAGIDALLASHARTMRNVTADERRAPYSREEYIRAHRSPRFAGAGPHGHGYTERNEAEGTLYYTFRISPTVVGISLDSNHPAGHYEGSLGTAQLEWLERSLTTYADDHVIVFSHHTSTSMDNLAPDPARPGERRHGAAELVTLLGRHRCVVAWVNGHSHRNAITSHGTFWEVNTASHVDFPQLARLLELTDNGDGTLSLHTTLIEAAAPHETAYDDLSPQGLASLYRELAFNAPSLPRKVPAEGEARDRNTELLLRKR
ncbi:3',5'-cyclic adenosine monophosphate phosphodiesterase CpdA [Streptomyces sp. RB5]|uniref:3',5'-cyclic adenosine monophosphate phosphodiesterase CpdA n=1 Tax=Streptomyces smaragdinus TaxID=2585196 RepID=A0A7K0CNW1_9ACTN|nr:TIGR03767 family metallophosphoesterase [Streptomyces smaragdinus]MQY15101.1 3',5'-cyclic adenosine monophosphate phosphodiesterase CpdA [Streptomyces smaragdinus]